VRGVDGPENPSILAGSPACAGQQRTTPEASALRALFKNQQVICVGTRVKRHQTHMRVPSIQANLILAFNKRESVVQELGMSVFKLLTEEFDPGSD
jgi:2-keto-4-pentenoate hydratase/2-oxohepta-3-ene-1,7-dioic acid hydratase in catechol pathway